jgi:hypothetical protein
MRKLYTPMEAAAMMRNLTQYRTMAEWAGALADALDERDRLKALLERVLPVLPQNVVTDKLIRDIRGALKEPQP